MSDHPLSDVSVSGLQQDILLWITGHYLDEIKRVLSTPKGQSLDEIFQDVLDKDPDLREKLEKTAALAKTAANRWNEFWSNATKEEKQEYVAESIRSNDPVLQNVDIETVIVLRSKEIDKAIKLFDNGPPPSDGVPWSPKLFLGRELTLHEKRNRSQYTRALNELEDKGIIRQIKGVGKSKPKTLRVELRRQAFEYCYLLLKRNDL